MAPLVQPDILLLPSESSPISSKRQSSVYLYQIDNCYRTSWVAIRCWLERLQAWEELLPLFMEQASPFSIVRVLILCTEY